VACASIQEHTGHNTERVRYVSSNLEQRGRRGGLPHS